LRLGALIEAAFFTLALREAALRVAPLGFFFNGLSQTHLHTEELGLGLADNGVNRLVIAERLELVLRELEVVLGEADHIVAVQLDRADHAEHDAAVG